MDTGFRCPIDRTWTLKADARWGLCRSCGDMILGFLEVEEFWPDAVHEFAHDLAAMPALGPSGTACSSKFIVPYLHGGVTPEEFATFCAQFSQELLTASIEDLQNQMRQADDNTLKEKMRREAKESKEADDKAEWLRRNARTWGI